jgi:FAD/FMN-containing dehydrogenase
MSGRQTPDQFDDGAERMDRRRLLVSAGALAAAPLASFATPAVRRVRPTDAGWPTPDAWAGLNSRAGGRLIKVRSPFAACAADPNGAACAELFRDLRNPYFVGDDVALTQTLGWTDAWTSRPSAYAVVARTTADVVAAVNFAREHRLRLVVKGGGHSYLGTSNAPDSLMVWTRAMNAIDLHDAFVAQGCDNHVAPSPAVTVGAGAIWMQAYNAVTTQAGRYVQGGGCTTVGVAGLVQSGGFGSFSKAYGTAAAGLLEAEIVTADGQVRLANPRLNPDLFWALKGGGGGCFGVVTRLTLRTHQPPPYFGAVTARIQAQSDAAFRRLVERILAFYRNSLFNPMWGEQIRFLSGNAVAINMVFQGLDQAGARAAWAPFFGWVSAAPADYAMEKPQIISIPARHFWDAKMLKSVPGVVRADDRPGASPDTFFWAGDGGQVGQVLHGYQSAWLPQGLLEPGGLAPLVDALIQTARTWGVSLHFNKGLAGGAPEAVAATRETATNPAVLDAFALAITAGEEPPAYPGVTGHEPDLAAGRAAARQIAAAMAPLRRLLPVPASYLSESDYFDPDWRRAHWGAHHPRLAAIKRRHDPEGLFFVHHGVGSEAWSADGFTRVA